MFPGTPCFAWGRAGLDISGNPKGRIVSAVLRGMSCCPLIVNVNRERSRARERPPSLESVCIVLDHGRD